MSFLEKVRTTETYFDKIKVKSKSYKRNTNKAIKHFEAFCNKQYTKTKEEVFDEIKKMEGEKKDRVIYEVLQDFSNYLTDKIRCNTQNTYFSGFKPYLSYMTLTKIHSEDIRQNVVLPRAIEEEPYPVSIEEQRNLFKHSSYKMIAFCVVSSSSGMRQGEQCQLRKRDFDFANERILIRIPGKYTKTSKPRRTFLSKEAEEYVKPILEKIGTDDLVFTDNPDWESAGTNIRSAFDLIRTKAGYNDLKYDSGTHKITIHSFRAFFITQTEKIHEGLGHALAGHGRYQKRYERYTDKDMLDFYLKCEPSLLIFSDQQAAKTNAEILDKLRHLAEKEKENVELRHNLEDVNKRLMKLERDKMMNNPY